MAMKRQYCTILPEVYWVAAWTGLPEGDEHLQQKTSRDSSAGPLPRNGNRRELPGQRGLPCPVIKNLPCDARDAGQIPGQETRFSHATEQLSLSTTIREPARLN